MSLQKLRLAIEDIHDVKRALVSQRFFKTGKGEYGEGDIFVGLTVPQSRVLAKEYNSLSFSDIQKLLLSKIHEERLIALLMLVDRFNKGSEKQKKEIFDFYLSQTTYINNWDLVDLSASRIVGMYLLELRQSEDSMEILVKLAHSKNMWERRIAIIATLAFINKNQFTKTLQIAEVLLNDRHDLIHKAVGWMMREIGKRDQKKEEEFLKKYYQKMPRTMLRYAIERFNPELRKKYLEGKVL